MAVREILEYPDPRLHELSRPVDRFDDALARTVEDLVDTLHASASIGLSAPQIDVREQVLVMDHSEDQSAPEVYINPVITQRRGFGLIEERCLSVPGMSAFVFRATAVDVRAQDASGSAFERTLTGMPAVCLQHEMDHFDGKLVADRMNWFKRRRLRAALDKAREPA
ncbi:MAG: peptide deformylase [Pseudomonadota bacterium]